MSCPTPEALEWKRRLPSSGHPSLAHLSGSNSPLARANSRTTLPTLHRNPRFTIDVAMLCSLCEALNFDELHYDFPAGYAHHATFAELAACTDCPFCSALHITIKDGPQLDRSTNETWRSLPLFLRLIPTSDATGTVDDVSNLLVFAQTPDGEGGHPIYLAMFGLYLDRTKAEWQTGDRCVAPSSLSWWFRKLIYLLMTVIKQDLPTVSGSKEDRSAPSRTRMTAFGSSKCGSDDVFTSTSTKRPRLFLLVPSTLVPPTVHKIHSWSSTKTLGDFHG